MRNKLVAALLAVSMAGSLCVTSGFMGQAKIAKAAESKTQSEGKYDQDFVKDHVIVKIQKKNGQNSTESVFSGVDVKGFKQIVNAKAPGTKDNEAESDGNGVFVVTLANQGKQNVIDAINTLEQNPDVKYAEPDYIITANEMTPNDSDYSKQYGMQKISAPITWDVTTGNKFVTVGVIDTGIDYNHPDLQENMWTNEGEIPGDGIDNDGNGLVDDVHGWNFLDDNSNIMDEYGHGTHCAGIIGAKGNNGQGVTGINMNVKMAALRFMGKDGHGTVSAAASAVQYANAMKMPITSNSWSGGGYSQTLRDAIANGGLFVAAAGNNGRDTDKQASYPSCYDCDNIISVAATDKNDQLASFSNYGEKTVDIAAPGVDVYSTMPNNSYDYMDGTSMACPQVAGAAALVLGFHTGYDSYQLKKAILDGVDIIDAVKGKTTTNGGRLNVAKAMGPVTVYKGVDYKDVYDYNYFHGAFQDVYYVHSHNPIETLQFFVTEAMAQGRPGNSTFSARDYKDRYPDLAKKYGDDWKQYYMHYINYGKAEGRLPH